MAREKLYGVWLHIPIFVEDSVWNGFDFQGNSFRSVSFRFMFNFFMSVSFFLMCLCLFAEKFEREKSIHRHSAEWIRVLVKWQYKIQTETKIEKNSEKVENDGNWKQFLTGF